MPERIEDSRKFSAIADNETKTDLDLIQNMMNNLRQNVHVDLYVNRRANDRENNIWRVSQEFYTDLYRKDEWSELIKSLRMADDGIHNLRFTNMYIEHHLNSYWESVKEIKKDSKFISDRLQELSKYEIEFERAVNNYLSSTVQEESKKEVKNFKFGKIPRKSKSAADSVNKMSLSYGLIFDRKLPHRDKLKLKKNFGKYCSLCGAVEVSSQNSVIRCRDCDGEIIVQGLCSSCDSFKGRLVPKEKKFNGILVRKKCSTCEFLRKKRICWDDKKFCYKCKKDRSKIQERVTRNYPNLMAPKLVNYVDPSSCCSDCDFTSSCDASLSDYKQKYRARNLSADSLVPLSDSDNLILNVLTYSQDYDVSSSISSSATEIRKGSSKVVGSISPILKITQSAHEPLSRVAEETLSVDEDFSSPREYFSAEDITLEDSESEPSKENYLVDNQNNISREENGKVISDVNSECNEKSTDSEEYEEALELSDTEDANYVDVESVTSTGKILLDDVVSQQPNLFAVSDRLHRAEEALAHIVEEGTKLEAGLSAMEHITQQNWKLSMTLQEIMLDIAGQLDYIHCSSFNKENFCAEEESDSSNEFEEALENLHSSNITDSDNEIFYDIPASNHFYLCLECGIETSYESLIRCLTCGGILTEIRNGLRNQELSFTLKNDSSKKFKNLPVNAFTSPPSNRQKNEVEEFKRAVFPVIVKRASSPFSLIALESRLKQIQEEASLLNDNNNIINLFIDDLKRKTTNELRSIQNADAVENGADPETTLFGFDVSIYQIRRLVGERMKTTEISVEETEEYEKEVSQTNRTFLEMKFEEVFKKEEQTALELEIFEQKLEVEGLIIKEMEKYFTCSTSRAVQNLDDITLFPYRPLTPSRRSNSEKFQIMKTPTKNEELMISIEIELENESKDNEKKAIRCEYKANLQKNILTDQSYTRKSDHERIHPNIALYPMWTSSKQDRRVLSRECSSQENEQMTFNRSSQDFGKLQNLHREDGFPPNNHFLSGIERVDLVEIKAPNFFYGSSDEETESCGGENSVEKHRTKLHSITAVRLPVAMYPITEIRLAETPFAILNSCKRTTCQKREFSRISQIELEESPQSGVVLVQAKAVSSVGVTECPSTAEGSFEEFSEIKSQSITSDTSFHRSGRSTWGNGSRDSILWKEAFCERKSSCLVKFIPVNMGGSSVASITLPDETLPVLITENVMSIEEHPAENRVSNSSQFKMEEQELMKALSLIREIENDVAEVKLHKAVAILPQLESILREHLQQKIEVLKKKSSTITNASLDVFTSTLNFITEDTVSVLSGTDAMKDIDSDERLGKMIQLLTGLEQAVRQISTTEENGNDCRSTDAGRIYDLLEALINRIKGVNGEPNMSEIEKTLELTSELDVAVRDYSSEFHGELSSNSQGSSGKKLSAVKSSGGLVAVNKLNMTKKKIFEVVAAEAQAREARIERDFDRIVRLEKENAEVLKFLDTLLDKTLRRVGELDETKGMIYTLNEGVKELLQKLELRTVQSRAVMHDMPKTRTVKMGRTPTLPSIQEVSSDNRTSESGEDDKSETMKDTLTGMIVALDNLKIKAVEKKKKYKEIFGEEGGFAAKLLPDTDQSNSSWTKDYGSANITEFNKIGAKTYYMAWSKPEIADEDSTITGYEIWVNGRVNQRVRNPERLKAVLYSVNPEMESEKLKIKLFALTDSNRRLSLADLIYP